MDTRVPTPERIRSSVVAVPPLARKTNLSVDWMENRRLIRYLEAGGVSIVLYGGNANFYNVSLHGYGELLEMLVESVARKTLVIPSAGPDYGTLMAQADVLRRFQFPAIMVLPSGFASTPEGTAIGLRHFADSAGSPIVLYLKREGYLSPALVSRLVEDGVVSWIKYAVVRPFPEDDRFLERLLEKVDRSMVVSGMGEQPAIAHMRHFGLNGFTSGLVCIAPRMSTAMLHAIMEGDFEAAEELRRSFSDLEDLRNRISPIRVLHDAVAMAGIAETGPVLPLLSNLAGDHQDTVSAAAQALRALEAAMDARAH